MPKIRCHYEDCVFLDDGFCSAAFVEIDPDQGCLTYRPEGEFLEGEEELFEDMDEELWEEEEEELEDLEDDDEI